MLSSTLNLKESIAQPLSSAFPPASTFEDDTGDSWPDQTDREDYDDDFYEQEKPTWKKNLRVESHSLPNHEDKMKRNNIQPKWKEPPKSEVKYPNSDDDLNALLKVKIAKYLYGRQICNVWLLALIALCCARLGRGRSCPFS